MNLFQTSSFIGPILCFHILSGSFLISVLGKQRDHLQHQPQYPTHTNIEKVMILSASENFQHAIVSGYKEEFKFSNGNMCHLNFLNDGTFLVEMWNKKEKEPYVIWESSTGGETALPFFDDSLDHHPPHSESKDSMDYHSSNSMDDMDMKQNLEFYLHLDKKTGTLAIYGIHPEDVHDNHNDIRDFITWSPMGPMKALKYLFLTDECLLTLEDKNSMVYWTSAYHPHSDSTSADKPHQHQDEDNHWISFIQINAMNMDHYETLFDASNKKKVVLKASNNMQNVIKAGESNDYKFPGKKGCRFNFEDDGNIHIEKFASKQNIWQHVWHSDIEIEDFELERYYLQLNKQGVLAIYGMNKDMKRPKMVWAFNEATKGLKFLYMNDQCILTLEKEKGLVHWATVDTSNIIQTHPPVFVPSSPPTHVNHPLPYPSIPPTDNLKLILDSENKNMMKAGKRFEIQFSRGKQCGLELEQNGNLLVEKFMEREKEWEMIWESESGVPKAPKNSFYLELNEKDGVLAIYSRKSSNIIWSAVEEPRRGLKFLMMNEECTLMLLDKHKDLVWFSENVPLVPSMPPSISPSPPIVIKPMKHLVLMNSNGAKNVIQGGESRQYKFPGQKGCQLTLEKNGNLMVEYYEKKTGEVDLIWESFSGVDEIPNGRVFLKLDKKDKMLAIYGGKPMKTLWDANGPSKDLKFLYIDDQCVLTLEKSKGEVHWSSEMDHKPPPFEYVGPFLGDTKSLVLTASQFPPHKDNLMMSGQVRDFWFMNGNKCSLILERNGNLIVQSYNKVLSLSNSKHVLWQSNSAQVNTGLFYLHLLEDMYGSLIINQVPLENDPNLDHSDMIWSISPGVKKLKYLFMNDECELTLEVEDVKWSSSSFQSASPSFSPTYKPSVSPSTSPTVSPSTSPTMIPTIAPTMMSNMTTSANPTPSPSSNYTNANVTTVYPSMSPTMIPNTSNGTNSTVPPNMTVSLAPSYVYTKHPTAMPSSVIVDHFNNSLAPTMTPTTNDIGPDAPNVNSSNASQLHAD